MDFKIETYKKWLNENVTLSDPFSLNSLRVITHHLLMGRNYRLLTEVNTKDKLFATYLWLTDIVENAKSKFGHLWREKLLNELLKEKAKSEEHRNLIYWLLGLTYKGAINLGLTLEDLPDILKEMISHCNDLFEQMKRSNDIDNAWLLMMAGSATLNIRGSQKSKIGKHLEKIFLKVLLTLLGFEENKNFWLGVARDLEVEREADAEIESKRGRIKIEVALIAPGNQEVIEDKIGRMSRNDMLIFDQLGAKTRVYQTAENRAVKLIQIRNNQPLVEVYRHLKPLVNIELAVPNYNEQELKKKIEELPEDIFKIN